MFPSFSAYPLVPLLKRRLVYTFPLGDFRCGTNGIRPPTLSRARTGPSLV
jgi:hypothetical protein